MTGRTGNNVGLPCPDCGLLYEPNDIDDIRYHERIHSSWKKAIEKYGKLYCNYAERIKIKRENRAISNNALLLLAERYDVELLVLRCLFSRSHLNTELCQKLIDEYGTLSGIRNGESYYYPEENTADFNKLASSYTQLNSSNKKKVINYGKSLVNIQQAEEEQQFLIPNAASQRTDLSKDELNDKSRNKHDDEIMDDQIYGTGTMVGNYFLQFEPNLQIHKLMTVK